MAVVNKISVGDIFYYTVDNVPTHTAPKGSVAILDSVLSSFDNTMMYINNDGAATWLKLVSVDYASIYLNGGTTLIEAGATQTLGSWYPFNATNTWNEDSTSSNFYFLIGEDDIYYSGDTKIRALTSQSCTIRGGTAKWVSFENGPSLNFTIPTRWNECFTLDNSSTVNNQATRLEEMDSGDFIIGAISTISLESGGPSSQREFIPKHCQLAAIKVDEALKQLLETEDFETSGFTDGGWTVVNDTENIWVVGQAENNTDGGTSSAYISNDGGSSATYNINNAEVSHFYKDFTFDAGGDISLVFDWKCQAENAAAETNWDYGAVVITSTATTPTAGSEVSTTQAAAGGNGRVGAIANLGKFNLAYGTTPGTTWNTESIDLSPYAGQTKRIIFTWKNDGSIGANPPFVVDNIKINEYVW